MSAPINEFQSVVASHTFPRFSHTFDPAAPKAALAGVPEDALAVLQAVGPAAGVHAAVRVAVLALQVCEKRENVWEATTL